jgi:hypothetical protein
MRARASIPPKRAVLGRPGSTLEQEAERAAALVTRGEPAPTLTTSGPGRVDRLASHLSPAPEDAEVVEGEPEQEEQVARLAAGGSSPAAPADWHDRRDSAGAGRPLPDPVRAELEPRFGVRFADVRIHTDARAAELAGEIDARAFTHRGEIFFGAGEYEPETGEGRRVIAHELAHVVQQRGGEAAPVQRMARLDSTTPGNISRANVAPWGGSDPRGNDYFVNTDAGSKTTAWVAYGGYAENLRYWCHGLSLGTYESDGYSVWSGTPLKQVLADEWTPVARASVAAGDIAVFTPGYDHSARFASPVVTGGMLDENASTLDTKNGQQARKTDTLANIWKVYATNTAYETYRHK